MIMAFGCITSLAEKLFLCLTSRDVGSFLLLQCFVNTNEGRKQNTSSRAISMFQNLQEYPAFLLVRFRLKVLLNAL